MNDLILSQQRLEAIDCLWTPEPTSGCWLWIGTQDRLGYGKVKVRGRFKRAHRVFYANFKGPVADDEVVRHRCDTPACINPDHLVAGTVADNNEDMRRRKRMFMSTGGSRKGAHNPKAKLTEENVRWIKQAPDGLSQKEMARLFNVSIHAIQDICQGKSWADV